MGILIAVAGLSGAGKTTAIDHLEQAGAGEKVYVGDLVLDELHRRGLPVNPNNEREVRLELRRAGGPAVLAALASPIVLKLLASGQNVLLDAVFSLEERNYLKDLCGGSIAVLAMVASFEIRAERLKSRRCRPLTRDQLHYRDETEIREFHTDRVIDEATYNIANEETLATFKEELDNFWRELSAGAFDQTLRQR